MARDIRQVGCQRTDYPDKCYLYDSSAVEHNHLKQEAVPICRFYKTDLVPFQWEKITIDGKVTSRSQFIGTCETLDHVEEMRPDMYVVDQTGMLLIVVGPVISDDDNASKNIGTRPKIKTTFKLRGLEVR